MKALPMNCEVPSWRCFLLYLHREIEITPDTIGFPSPHPPQKSGVSRFIVNRWIF
jgi:hypothetical protein